MDEGEVPQSLEGLKRIRAGYLGHLTRLYKGIKELLTRPENYKEVVQLNNEIGIAFAKYELSHLTYCNELHDDAYKAKENDDFVQRRKEREVFAKDIEDWLYSVKHHDDLPSHVPQVPKEPEVSN